MRKLPLVLECKTGQQRGNEIVGILGGRVDEARRRQFVGLWSTDPSPDVRAMALALTKGCGIDLPTLAADPQPALVRAAALRLADPQTDRKLLFAQFDDADPFIRQAALSSLLRGGAIGIKFLD